MFEFIAGSVLALLIGQISMLLHRLHTEYEEDKVNVGFQMAQQTFRNESRGLSILFGIFLFIWLVLLFTIMFP